MTCIQEALILNRLKEGISRRQLAKEFNITEDKARNYIKNYRHNLFGKYLDIKTNKVIITKITEKQLHVNVLLYFECNDTKRIIETLANIKIKVSVKTVEKYKKIDLIIPVDIESFKYLKGIYLNCMGFNKKGFIGRNKFFGTDKATFSYYYSGIYRLAKLINECGLKQTYKKEIESIERIEDNEKQMNFFVFFLWKIAKVVANNDLRQLYQVDYIYYSTSGYDALSEEQKIYLQKQKDEGKILLNKIYFQESENYDWGEEVKEGEYE